MSFKKDKYEVISKAVSGDMANFLYMYSLLKRQVCKTFMDTRRISKFTKDFGTWQDPQVPTCGYIKKEMFLKDIKIV